MGKKSLAELIEIALEINLDGKKSVLEKLGISERSWSKLIKDTEIYFDKSAKVYIVPNLSKTSGSNLTNLEDHTCIVEKTLDIDKREKELNQENLAPEYMDVMDIIHLIAKGEATPCDKINVKNLPIYSPDSEEKSKAKIRVKKTIEENIKTKLDEVNNSETRKSKADTPKKIDLITQKFIVSKDIMKALGFKALTEGIGINELVRDLLLQSIEKKYFLGLE